MSLSSQLSRLAFFSESSPASQPSHFFPHRNLRGKSSGAEDLSTQRWVSLRWLNPRVPHYRPTESFHPFSSLARTSIPLQLRAIWSHSVEAMTRDGRQPVIGSFRCGGAVGLVPRSCPLVSSPGMDADLFRILSNAVEEGLEWSPTEEPFRSHLDERFLPERDQAPRQQSSPFFPEVHDEITKSWHAPYSSRLRASSSSALTSVEGMEEKGYDSLPPLDESVAAHLCPPTASGRKAKAAHPSKLCRTTSALAGRAYSSAAQRFTPRWFCKFYRQNSSAPWMSLTQTPQLSMSCAVRPTWPCATKMTAQTIGRSMASLVQLERYLWLNLTEMKDADKVPFLDSPVSPTGLFGPAVEGFAKRFKTKQVVSGNATLPA